MRWRSTRSNYSGRHQFFRINLHFLDVCVKWGQRGNLAQSSSGFMIPFRTPYSTSVVRSRELCESKASTMKCLLSVAICWVYINVICTTYGEQPFSHGWPTGHTFCLKHHDNGIRHLLRYVSHSGI